MKGLSLNVAAIVLYIAGSVIISGSNIWIIKNGLDPGHAITVTASNLASIFFYRRRCYFDSSRLEN